MEKLKQIIRGQKFEPKIAKNRPGNVETNFKNVKKVRQLVKIRTPQKILTKKIVTRQNVIRHFFTVVKKICQKSLQNLLQSRFSSVLAVFVLEI